MVGKLGDVAKKEKMTAKDEHTSLTDGGDVENKDDVVVEQKGLVSRFTERLWRPK